MLFAEELVCQKLVVRSHVKEKNSFQQLLESNSSKNTTTVTNVVTEVINSLK